jgi:hypothetical protein
MFSKPQKVFVVLGEDTNHLFDRVVGDRDDAALDGVDQIIPVALQEVEDG